MREADRSPSLNLVQTPKRRATWDQAMACVLAMLCATTTGCLALGVPSQRFHDPVDQGGILGSWKRSDARTPADITRELAAEGAVITRHDGSCGSGLCHGELGHGNEGHGPNLSDERTAPLDIHPLTGSCIGGAAEEPPEVPWPKYHPLPTRPVFGSQFPN